MQRLTGADATFLYLQNATSHMEVAGVIVIDPTEVEGGFSFERAREIVESRLHLVPMFRRRLVHVPFELDTPRWIEDPDFDLDFHVRRAALPSPGGMAELETLVGDVLSRPLDRSRPLWELHVVEGLEDGRIAVISKTHHAAVDGVSGAEMMASLVDLEKDAPDPEPPAEPWQPEREPSDLELLAGSVETLIRQPMRGLKATRRLARVLLRDQRAKRQGDGTSGTASPPSPFNVTVTPHRLVHLFDVPFDDLQRARVGGATVNDVLLAAVGGALRDYLRERDELPEESLVAFVPVSTRDERPAAEGGNATSVVFAGLATDIDDASERLARIHEATDKAKQQHDETGASTVTDLTEIAGPAAAALAGRLVSRFRINQRTRLSANVVVSNIPGSPIPLFIAGASVDAIYPLGPVADGSALNITAMSYQDRMHIGISADRATVPDVGVLGQLFRRSLDELLERAGLPATGSRR